MLPEVGGVEVLVIAALALIIIGPKDLPLMLRKFGKFVGKMRAMAQEFRSSFDELARQSELEELRKEVEAMRVAQNYDPTGMIPGAYGAQPGVEIEALPAYEPAPEATEAAPKPRKARKAADKPKLQPKPPAKPKTSAKPKAPAKATATKPAASKAAARSRKKVVT
jgi:sec-independent protein translocase protein TatB